MSESSSGGNSPSTGAAPSSAPSQSTPGQSSQSANPSQGQSSNVPSGAVPTNAQGQVTPDKGSKVQEVKPEADGTRKFIVKVNGADVEVSEDELKTGYQTRKAADEKFREAAMLRKQSEEFISMLRDEGRLFDVIKQLGHDPRTISEKYLVQIMEDEMMDPRDRELRDAKKQLQEIEDQKKAAQKAQEEAQRAELTEKYTTDYVKGITDVLQTAGLPKTEHTVKRMAYYMHQGLQRGYNLSAGDVVDMVKQDYITEQKSLFGALDGDMLLQLLGDDVANKIRKHDISKVKNTHQQLATPQKQPEAVQRKDKPKNSISKDDWRAKMERIKNGQDS